MKRIAAVGIGLALCLGSGSWSLAQSGTQTQSQSSAPSNPPASTQSSTAGSSLGDYARQIRKNSGASSKPKVFDNDNLPTEDKLSVVGQPAQADANSSESQPEESANAASTGNKASGENKTSSDKTASDQKTGSTAKTQDEEDAEKQAAWRQWNDRIKGQKDSIDLMARELDVLQREYQLRAAAFYADAGNRLRNQADWDQQDAKYKQEIADKQTALDSAKQKLDDMQEDARKAGVPENMRGQ